MKILTFSFFLLIQIQIFSQGFDEVQIISHQITDNVYMLEGMGGNIGLFVGENEVIMIDDQFAELSDKLNAAILKISDHPIKYLVNTHWHGDHTGGNEVFANNGSTIVAHENVRERLSNDQLRPFRRSTPASPEAAWPTVTFDENMKIHVGQESIHLIHIHNAHTDGDALIYFPRSNVLHMGDCFFNKLFPYVDLDSGGTPDGAIEAVKAALLLADDNTQIIPGHGPAANRTDLLAYQTMWNTMRDRIKEAIERGVTKDNADFAILVEGYENWEWSFITAEKFITMMFSAYAPEE